MKVRRRVQACRVGCLLVLLFLLPRPAVAQEQGAPGTLPDAGLPGEAAAIDAGPQVAAAPDAGTPAVHAEAKRPEKRPRPDSGPRSCSLAGSTTTTPVTTRPSRCGFPPGKDEAGRHHMIDWNDSLGFLCPPELDQISRRLGYAYYFDVGIIGRELVSLGLRQEPWDRAHLGPVRSGRVAGLERPEEQPPPPREVGR